MASPTLLLTKLDAVNLMLSSIGQAPVNSLSVSGIRDVNIAVLALDNVTRSVLSHGWSFNTDKDYPLTPDVDGKIAVPAGAASVDPEDQLVNAVIRPDGETLRLYDADNRTFDWRERGLTELKANIVWLFEFEQIPQAARDYIALRAARLFQSQVIGSDILYRFTEQHEAEALATFARSESRTKDRNIFRSRADVNRIFDRIANPVRY